MWDMLEISENISSLTSSSRDAAMNNEMDACGFSADNVFGPAVASCASRFDFTLLFEQIFFSTVPSATFILISAGYLGYLLRQTAKTKHGTTWLLRWAKQVLFPV
jgi:hypothetical protein